MIAAAFLALALAAAEPAPPPVRARADLASIIRPSDYETVAMVRGEEGEVRFTLSVAADGGVTGCRVTASSGSPRLDEATCAIVMRRVRYAPARNASGEAVPDEVSERVRWALPRAPTGARARSYLQSYFTMGDYPPEARRRGEQGTVGFEADISPEGRVVACRIMQSSGSRQLDLRTCQILLVRAHFRPATDAEGHPVPDTITSRVRWVWPSD